MHVKDFTHGQACNHSYILKKPLNILHYYCRADTFKDSFSLFKASLLKMGCPHANSMYKVHSPVGVRLLACVCLGLSHLKDFLNHMRQTWKTQFILVSSL